MAATGNALFRRAGPIMRHFDFNLQTLTYKSQFSSVGDFFFFFFPKYCHFPLFFLPSLSLKPMSLDGKIVND